MKYTIYYVSDDGLLKKMKDGWDDNYSQLFKYEYDSPELAEKAICEAAEQEGRIKGFYNVEFVILPCVNIRPQ